MANEQEVKKALSRLMSAFAIYNKDPEAIRSFTRIVCEKLTPFPAFIVDRAVEKIIETQPYMPKISEMLSACFGERDNEMRRIGNKLADFKADWYADVIHPLKEWEELRDEYLKVGARTSAAYVMEGYKAYCKKHEPASPEKMQEIKEKLIKLRAQLEEK